MALSECGSRVDQTGRELLAHGTSDFPAACYQDDFRQMDVPWHWHEEWEAVRVIEGSCTVSAGQRKAFFRAGEGFFINSGILHGCWDMDSSGCVFHSIVFHPRLIGGSLDSLFHQRYVLPLLTHPDMEFVPLSPLTLWQARALDAIEAAWQHGLRGAPGYEFEMRASLSRLVFLLCSQAPAVRNPPSAKSLRDAERIKIMLTFLHDNFSSEISMAQIAASASVSESECLRCFRSAIGVTPIQYLKQYRLQHASLLLTQTDERISEIASRCGFQDMSYFTRSFRAAKGCTPSQYRKTAGL